MLLLLLPLPQGPPWGAKLGTASPLPQTWSGGWPVSRKSLLLLVPE